MNNADGYMTSANFIETISLLHKRKAETIKQVKEVQSSLAEMNINQIPKDDKQRRALTNKLTTLVGEQGNINSRLAEFSLLYSHTLDQILIGLLEVEHSDLYKELLIKSKNIYSQSNQKRYGNKKGESQH